MVKVKVGPQVYLGLIRIYKLKHSIAHLICYIVRFTTIHILSQTLCDNVEMAESRLSKTHHTYQDNVTKIKVSPGPFL